MSELTTNKRDKILDLAYRLENRGDIPLNQICAEVKKDLQQPIKYGVLTNQYINFVLPAKYKNTHYNRRHNTTKQEPEVLRKKTRSDEEREITLRIKRFPKAEDVHKILSIIIEMQKKY